MAEHVAQLAKHVRGELSRVIIGQEAFLDHLIVILLCRGHALIEGVPGLAKTLAVKTLARVLQLRFQRVQCTPDLMPADVVGTNVFNAAAASFSLHQGPIFTNLLLVDEINRTPPRTQSALLEAMEERQVTIDGVRYPLPEFFTVFATQNPIEFEGTYPLPEAQLDRFLLKIRISYPDASQETRILEAYQKGFDARELDKIDLVPMESSLLQAAIAEVQQERVEAGLLSYITEICRRTRDWPSLTLGASSRAAVNLLLVSKAFAALDARDYLIPDDVKTAAPPVLRHRLILRPEADLEGLTADSVIQDLLATVPLPK